MGVRRGAFAPDLESRRKLATTASTLDETVVRNVARLVKDFRDLPTTQREKLRAAVRTATSRDEAAALVEAVCERPAYREASRRHRDPLAPRLQALLEPLDLKAARAAVDLLVEQARADDAREESRR